MKQYSYHHPDDDYSTRGYTTTRKAPYAYPGERQQVKPIATRRKRPLNTQLPRSTDQDIQIDVSRITQYAPMQRAITGEVLELDQKLPQNNRSIVPVLKPKPRQRKHALLWIGSTMLACWGFWQLTTIVPAFLTNTLIDPIRYGPMRGNTVSGVYGDGDSEQNPTKFIAMNNNGQIWLFKATANNPAKSQIFTEDLHQMQFSDPEHAVVEIEAGDYNGDGFQDVKVTVYAASFDLPFHRHQDGYILYGDGKGNLHQQHQ